MNRMTGKSLHLQPQPKNVPERIGISLLVGIGFVLKVLYRVFFSWWLNPALDYWAKKSFVTEINHAFPFLFEQYHATIAPPPRPGAQSPDMAYAWIAATNLLFEFTRWHDENYAISVSPTFAPRHSYDLIDALRVAAPEGLAVLSPSGNSWAFFARLLEPRFQLLQVAFNQDNFAGTKQKIAQLRLAK